MKKAKVAPGRKKDDSSDASGSSTSSCDADDEDESSGEADGEHTYYWVTRSNRKSRCFTCRTEIDAYSFRMVYEAESALEAKAKDGSAKWGSGRWGTTFWKYFHLHRDCLAGDLLSAPLPDVDLIKTDVNIPPAKMKENPEQRASKTKDAVKLFHTEFRVSRPAP